MSRPLDNHSSNPSLSTVAIHGDDPLNTPHTTDVAPALHVSTTFRYPDNPEDLVPEWSKPISADNPPIYSRLSNPNTTRFEHLLSQILKHPSITYSSGLSAFFALITYFRPNVVAIGDGYHGCHSVLKIHTKLYGLKVVDLFDESSWDAAGLGNGDIIHVETPVNPTGEARNLKYFADLAHKRGAILTVDATFGPPPLLDPFAFGADIAMHSGTKYIGGHSDLLCGVLAVREPKAYEGLQHERVYLGSVMGSLEGWLGIRSLRTLELRVLQQSNNATKLAGWLDSVLKGKGGATQEETAAIQKVLFEVRHASIQAQQPGTEWLKEQMPNGYGPTFAILLKNGELAKHLPSNLKLFHHATSLGGVESLVEWRRMSDSTVDERVLRLSIGIEGREDLKADILQAFIALAGQF
ncbi:hypothetical protein HDV00_006429 [Rhizophlyctis rosea]|nr:hypothetical protein HDV00_006429 [Rhizophlyctis rosea]